MIEVVSPRTPVGEIIHVIRMLFCTLTKRQGMTAGQYDHCSQKQQETERFYIHWYCPGGFDSILCQ